ncbi:hypothetical protein KNE206_37060 [Kitasatospora sp. NE20-6]|uniref:dynamin family protein n=1 Tax=Kitasatospora sp. NE20-6 TaxID=2859066 RepID=UPI0034DC242A
MAELPAITDLLAALDRHGRLLPVPSAELRTALAAARRARERSHLAVVGPEGAGKSTLVNALVGAEVAPVSAYLPGTVAPVHVLAGASPQPRFRIVHAGTAGAPAETDTDRQEFDGWMLQDHNRDNRRRVLRGEVRVASGLLADGLRLVDLPGANSVSAEVTAQTSADLDGSAFTAVLVTFGRVSIAALSDVLRQLAASPHEVRVAAVVFNEAAPPPSERMTDHLTMRRRSIAEYLLPADPDGTLGVASAGVYALHLPSFLPGADGPVPDGQQEQWKAFRTEIAERVRRNVAETAAAAARHAVPLLDAALTDRVRRIDRVRGRTVPASEGTALSEELFTAASRRLAAAEADSRTADWRAFEPDALRLTAKLRSRLDAVRQRIAANLTLPKHEATKVDEEIRGLLTETQDALAAAAGPGFHRLAAGLLDITAETLTAFDARLPTGAAPAPGSPAAVSSLKVGSYSYQSAGDIFNEIGDDGVSGFIVALLPTTWGGLMGFHYLGGGHLGHTLRLLRATRKEIEGNLAPSATTGCAPTWLAARGSTVTGARTELRRLLSARAALVTAPTADASERLAAERRGIEAARRDLAAQRDRLGTPGRQ